MKTNPYFFVAFFLFFVQNLPAQWAVHLHLNEYFPQGNSLKTQFPMLWYDSKNDRGVLLGGFGVGGSFRKQWVENRRDWVFQANLQRSRFYDEPSVFTDENGQPLGGYIGVNTHWALTTLTMSEFYFGKLNAAIGLGARFVAFSKTNYGEWLVNGLKTDLNLPNRSLMPAVVVLPISLGWRVMPRFDIRLRSEYFITPSSRIHKKERAIMIYGEIGYRFLGNE